MSKLSTTTNNPDEGLKLPPIHVGEFLREEFLIPLNITQDALARACGVSLTVLDRVVREEALIDGEVALRLARYFGTSPAFWMNIQARHQIETAQDEFESEITKIVPRSLEAAE